MHARDRTARLKTIPVVRDCPACSWQVVSDAHTLAEVEQATHRMAAHATLPERVQVQHLVAAYRQILGPLPAHLLVLVVQQVLDTPTTTTTTPVEVVSAA